MIRTIYLIGGIAVFLLALYLGGRLFAVNKVDELIEQANKEGNKLTVGERSLSFNLLYLGLELDDVELDQTTSGKRITGTVDHVDLDGLSVVRAMSGGVKISDLIIDGARLKVYAVAPDTSAKKGGDGKTVSVNNLQLANSGVEIFGKDSVLKAAVSGLSANGLLDLPLAPASAPAIIVEADSVFFPATDDTDQLVNDLSADLARGQLKIGTFRLSPKQSARNFLTTIQYKRPWQALRLAGIEASGVPFDSLLAGGRSVIHDVNIGDLNFEIYENPNLERDPAEPVKKFPVEAFRDLPQPVWLHSLIVDRANIAYGVHVEGSEQPDITFTGTIKAGNFSTWKQDEPAFAQMDCTFEKNSPLTIRFDLDQSGDGRSFRVTGDLKKYDLTDVNPLMVVAANVNVERGNINHLTHDFSVANGVSKGELTLKYDHLEVKMEGKGAWLINLVEDIAIRDSNPRNDGELVVGTVYAEHDPTKSFFNLYWKSVVAGMTSSVAGKVFTPEELKPK